MENIRIDAHKVSDDELLGVSGGYVEKNGYAAGYEIKCPKCGASSIGNFDRNDVDALGQAYYRCTSCGCAFLLDSGGYGTILYGSNNQFTAEKALL